MARRRVTTAEAAAIIGNIKPATIRQWVTRGYIKRGDDGLLDLGEVLAAERGRSLAQMCLRAGMDPKRRAEILAAAKLESK